MVVVYTVVGLSNGVLLCQLRLCSASWTREKSVYCNEKVKAVSPAKKKQIEVLYGVTFNFNRLLSLINYSVTHLFQCFLLMGGKIVFHYIYDQVCRNHCNNDIDNL